MATAIDEKNLPKLREYLASRNFTDKYFQLSRLINKFDSGVDIKQNLSVLKILYEDFLYEYPFNHTYWAKYASFYTKIQQFDIAHEIYEQAVSLNPFSPELWNSYISFLSQNYENDMDKIIELYERAVKNINLDNNAQVIWDSYIHFLESKDLERAHALFWKILNYPVSSPNQLIQRYERFVNSLDTLEYQTFIEHCSDLVLPVDAATNKSTVIQHYSDKMREASNVNLPADSEKKLHDLLERTEFDGEELDKTKEEALQNYLLSQEKNLSHDKLIYLFKKCLIVKCKYGEYWTKLLTLLEKDPSTQNQIDESFQKYDRHFNIIENKEKVFFFLADLKESLQDISACREIYTSLEQKKVFEAYLRHLYMEIRINNIQSVVDIFLNLSQSIQDGDQIAFVIQEMGEILNKLGEVESAAEIIKQFNEKKTEYSKFFFISWINFLKSCKKPWEEIESVFKIAFEKASDEKDKEGLWKVFVYTARSYCNDINTLREIERRFILREEPGEKFNENGLNSKREYSSIEVQDNEDGDQTRKQVKLS